MSAVGPYELHEPIGEGGMAQVFRAVGPEGEQVAVKILRGGVHASEEQLRRFEREIQAAQRLQHPHLIGVIDHGIDEAHGAWLAMPLLRGMTLRDLFGGKAICPEAALVLLFPLAEALAALHAHGLTHRDVKPENVMLSPLGDLTLVDLGLALGPTDTRHTREGEVAGSVPYMSPERIEGREVDPSADVWAFAVMLYELIHGARPFERARSAEEVAAILSGTFEPLAKVERRCGQDLSWLIDVCLSAEPWKRPKDGAALLDRLRPLRVGPADDARAARVCVLSDPAGYTARVAPLVVAGLQEEVRALIANGDRMDAVRLLDRALAYAPDDPETLALVEAASSDQAAPVAQVEAAAPGDKKPSRGRARLLGAAALVTMAALAGAAWFVNDSRESDPVEDRAPQPASASADPIDAGEDAAADPLADTAPLHFHPIPPDVLSNDDPPNLDDVAAPPGEPLFSESDLREDPEVALAESVRALEDDPDDRTQLIRKAFALLALDRRERGFEAIEALLRAHPGSPEALTAAAFVAMRRGLYDDADQLLSRAIEADPQYEDALRHRGVLRTRRGRTRDGYADLVRVLAIDPDNINALAELTEIYQDAHRIRDAAPFLRRLTVLTPRNPTAWVSLATVLLGSSDEAEIDEAIEAVERGLELNPRHTDGLRDRCYLLSRNARAGAVAACTNAIAVLPRDPDLFVGRAVALVGEERYRPALADADRAVELAPDQARMYANRAILRGRSGDQDGAIEDTRTACALGHQRSCGRLRRAGIPTPRRGP